MDFYIAERLKPYAINLDLPYEILPFIAGRINWGNQISLMDLAKEIQFKFNNHPYLKENTLKGRPKFYGDLCLLFIALSQAGHGRMLQVNLADCIYIGDVEI
ncbi:hypothetical protein BUZ63_06320 [Staphylococcus pasteuri]|uniref:hypothetical protein n=1 Tax=Staphylococcus pasteuri TaxID=45972 RepID=UPI000E697306|nr:hypothetical protein [Staphylococcus pasteuri]RIO39885.1 hypothetical protein BUZ63_06320 [Staphylococcus pasteuri]